MIPGLERSSPFWRQSVQLIYTFVVSETTSSALSGRPLYQRPGTAKRGMKLLPTQWKHNELCPCTLNVISNNSSYEIPIPQSRVNTCRGMHLYLYWKKSLPNNEQCLTVRHASIQLSEISRYMYMQVHPTSHYVV